MTILEFKNHPVWQDLTEVLENLNANALVREHLELCDYKISGYWDEQDEFYEEIILPHSLSPELVSSAVGFTGQKRWLQLKFCLKVNPSFAENSSNHNQPKNLGVLTIIYDKNLQFIDENWQINIDSALMR